MRLVRGGKVDTDASAVQIFTIQSLDGGRGALDVAHGDEAEAARSTGTRIIDDDDFFDGSNGVEFVLEVLFSPCTLR